MLKLIFTSFASLSLLALAAFSPLAADGQSGNSPDPEHINTVQALNYAAMSVYRVERIPSKVTVAEEYSGIINNIAFGNINDDPELKKLIESMMDAYTEERLSETDRNLLRRQYEVQVNQAFLKVKPISHIKTEVAARNAEKMMMAMRADGLLGKLFAGSEAAGNALTEYTLALQENERVATQARSEENEFMQQRMTQEWQLEKEKIRRFNGLHKDLINAAWSLLRRYNLPDKYRLTDENIEAYFRFLKEKDPATAVRLGERMEEKLAGYPPFWLYYGLAAQRNGKLDLARKCYENCEKFSGSILRTDHFLAAMARYKIFVLGEKEVDEAKRLLGLIEKHSAADDWNNVTFAAMQWYQLGDKAKADKLLQQNIDDKFNVPLHTELRRQLAAGKLDLAAVQGVAIREFREPSQLEKLAQGGNAEAQFQLGVMLVNNTSISEQNPGIQWLVKAAEQGHFFARCELATQFSGKDNRWTKDAAKLFRELDSQKESSSLAMNFLGRFYGNGTGTAKDAAKAFDCWSKAAAQGLANAQNNLGGCYLQGEGVAKDPAKAVEWYSKAAEQGNAWAQYHLGTCYINGTGVAKDPAKAVEWYSKAAAQGFAWAQNELGLCYINGLGIAKDESKAAALFSKAAAQGVADAQLYLGLAYEFGTGVAQNPVKAAEWYGKAAAQGDAEAQTNFGNCYYKGFGVDEDQSKAFEWYSKAAAQGHAHAQNNLGVCYQYGIGVANDPAKAVEWYSKAAAQGNAFAQTSLGWCYDNGTGVAKDPAKAVEWYSKAAAQGHADAQNNLGWCYKNGTGVAKDPAKAVEWYSKAAAQGNANAQFNLGLCYDNGTGVAKDPAKAVEWYSKAAAQGNALAQGNLGWCYDNGTGVAKDPAKAVEWYSKAAAQGNAVAQFNLGLCYENGTGVAKDLNRAVEWYRKAAEQGDEDAKKKLQRLGR